MKGVIWTALETEIFFIHRNSSGQQHYKIHLTSMGQSHVQFSPAPQTTNPGLPDYPTPTFCMTAGKVFAIHGFVQSKQKNNFKAFLYSTHISSTHLLDTIFLPLFSGYSSFISPLELFNKYRPKLPVKIYLL